MLAYGRLIGYQSGRTSEIGVGALTIGQLNEMMSEATHRRSSRVEKRLRSPVQVFLSLMRPAVQITIHLRQIQQLQADGLPVSRRRRCPIATSSCKGVRRLTPAQARKPQV